MENRLICPLLNKYNVPESGGENLEKWQAEICLNCPLEECIEFKTLPQLSHQTMALLREATIPCPSCQGDDWEIRVGRDITCQYCGFNIPPTLKQHPTVKKIHHRARSTLPYGQGTKSNHVRRLKGW